MGHLVEAFKKLDQKRAAERPKPVRRADATQRAAIRPKPVRRTPAAKHAAKTWRVDEPHRTSELRHADAAVRAVAVSETEAHQSVNEMPAAPAPEAAAQHEAQTATRGDGWPAADIGWRFPAPAIPKEYYDLAACLVAQASGTPRPHSLLLTAVTSAGLDAVSLGALAVVLSSRGNVLWIDTRNTRPTSAVTGPARITIPGWRELRSGQATWAKTIAPTSLAGVSFVGCGDLALEANGPGFDGQLFEPLRSTFSFVLIHGGLAETSKPLSNLCGVTGLVVALGHTSRSQVDRALQTLGTAGGSPPLLIAVEPRSPE